MKSKGEIKNYVGRKTEEKYRNLSDMLMKWKMFPANNKLKIKKYNGEYVDYSGVKFEGSPKIVFRNFFDPYIEAYCIEILKDVFDYLKERNISSFSGRSVTIDSLKNLTAKFYSAMLEVDKGLDRENKIVGINKFIENQVNSYFHEKFWNKERVWKTALVLLGIGGGSFVIKLVFHFNK